MPERAKTSVLQYKFHSLPNFSSVTEKEKIEWEGTDIE